MQVEKGRRINQKPQKIRVAYPFVGQTLGGAQVSTSLLVREFASDDRSGFDPVLFVFAKGVFADFLAKHQIPFEKLNFPHLKEGNIFYEVLQVLLLTPFCIFTLLRHRISILHTGDIRMHLMWGLACKLTGVKHVWHQRTANSSLKNAIFARFAHRVITISRHCLGALPGFVARRGEVIYNPFELQTLCDKVLARAQMVRELGIVDSDRLRMVAFVGRASEQKRFRVYEEMAKRLATTERDFAWVFVVIGDRAEHEHPHIRFLGHRSPMETWLRACDILVAPGVNEGFGRVLVEAMGQLCAVVASDSGGHREVIINGKTGILVPPDQPELFADAVVNLCRNPDGYRMMCEAARSDVQGRFAVKPHAAAVARVYENMLPAESRA